MQQSPAMEFVVSLIPLVNLQIVEILRTLSPSDLSEVCSLLKISSNPFTCERMIREGTIFDSIVQQINTLKKLINAPKSESQYTGQTTPVSGNRPNADPNQITEIEIPGLGREYNIPVPDSVDLDCLERNKKSKRYSFVRDEPYNAPVVKYRNFQTVDDVVSKGVELPPQDRNRVITSGGCLLVVFPVAYLSDATPGTNNRKVYAEARYYYKQDKQIPFTLGDLTSIIRKFYSEPVTQAEARDIRNASSSSIEEMKYTRPEIYGGLIRNPRIEVRTVPEIRVSNVTEGVDPLTRLRKVDLVGRSILWSITDIPYTLTNPSGISQSVSCTEIQLMHPLERSNV